MAAKILDAAKAAAAKANAATATATGLTDSINAAIKANEDYQKTLGKTIGNVAKAVITKLSPATDPDGKSATMTQAATITKGAGWTAATWNNAAYNAAFNTAYAKTLRLCTQYKNGTCTSPYTAPAAGPVTSVGVDGSDGTLTVTFTAPLSENLYAFAVSAADSLPSANSAMVDNVQKEFTAQNFTSARRGIINPPGFNFKKYGIGGVVCNSISPSSAMYLANCVSDDSSGLSDADIAGIVIGSVLGFICLLAIVYFLFGNKKHQPTDDKHVVHDQPSNNENVVASKSAPVNTDPKSNERVQADNVPRL